MEWETGGESLNVKEVMQASLTFGRTESSQFLRMKDSYQSSLEIPKKKMSEFSVELDEVDF